MSFDASATLEHAVPALLVPPPSCRRPAPVPAIESHAVDSPCRDELEEFVRREFLVHFAARVTQFMPELLALRTASGELRSVVGCRAAAREPLFLETYTREPIEIALARRNGFFVPRARIVEIGSLACRNAGGAVAIVQALVPYLLGAGFTWVVFTGATTVMNVFRHLGLAPQSLCPADPLLLGEARHAWGTYYDHAPHVMAGRISDGAAAVAPRRWLRGLPQ
jgi:hypothetical protein